MIQGGAVGGWGPVAEANTAESFGTTFNLGILYSQDIQGEVLAYSQLILHISHLVLRFLQVFWFLVTGATGPTGTSTPCTYSSRKYPYISVAQILYVSNGQAT